MNVQKATKARQSALNGKHAVVIGGSMAGLLAARVLSDYIANVTVIDRDTFPTTPEHRAGVPQSHHAHALLPRGQMIIEQLFPGMSDDLRADGAVSVHDVVPVVFVTPAGKLPSERLPGEFMAFSRFLLEWHVRQRMMQRSNVRFMSGYEVDELMATPDHAGLTGVQLKRRDDKADIEILQADLIVDASGRHSKAPEWLAALGYEAPSEETISSNLGYASRFYAKPADFPADWQGIIINGRPPHNPRAGLILPIEQGRWHVTMGGFAGNYPPTDEEGFLQWAHDLADPSIYEAIRVAEPLSPIRGYRTPANRLRHFEQLDRWPRGLIVMGDAVCAFNPIYGQGMTVSAMGAMVLAEQLGQAGLLLKPGFEQQCQRALARTVAAPWLVATGEDLRWPEISLQGGRHVGTDVLHRYMDLVLQQAVTDPQVTQAYMAVIGMLAPPTALMQPRIMGRVIGGAVRRATNRYINPSNDEAQFALSPEAIATLQMRPAARYAHG